MYVILDKSKNCILAAQNIFHALNLSYAASGVIGRRNVFGMMHHWHFKLAARKGRLLPGGYNLGNDFVPCVIPILLNYDKFDLKS